ncbi:hypothetical protein ATCCBAA256_04520 [Mycobacterium montefiorense]|nr:hypothetical protein ATCCBAA256_04520 [Mycobacterium montefiorense]
MFNAPDSSAAPRVVDDDVDRPIPLDSGPHGRHHLLFDCDIDAYVEPANLVGHPLPGVGIEFGDDDTRAFVGESARDPLADSRAATSDQRDTSVQLPCHHADISNLRASCDSLRTWVVDGLSPSHLPSWPIRSDRLRRYRGIGLP